MNLRSAPVAPGIRWLMALLLALAGCLPVWAQPDVDPPGRVGRLADLAGAVWWFDLEQGAWSEARRNRPLTTGDRLSTGRDARAELRIGSTTVKLTEGTEVELLRLDDERVRIQLHRGSIALRLRSREVALETEFGTDEAWLQPQRGGLYRLDREDDTTFALAWRGEMRVEGEVAFDVDSGRRVQLWREGANRLLRHRWSPPQDDVFAARVLREDRDDERSVSAAYVSTEMTGWEELDRHGRWDQHPEYGPVWTPVAVQADWVPYRQGRWEWVRPWGWTWVDDAAWGFAPFHYGRWVSWRNRWCWVPGSYVPRPVFAPALVAWLDGPAVGIGLRVGGPTLSWVPLAPWEPYRPHYRSSPSYHDRVNTPDHRRWRPPQRYVAPGVAYGNQGVPQAVTVVPSDVLRPRPAPARPVADAPRPPPPPVRVTRPDHEWRTPASPTAPAAVMPAPVTPPKASPPVLAAPPPHIEPPHERDDRATRMRSRAPGGDARRDPGPADRPAAAPVQPVQPAPPPMRQVEPTVHPPRPAREEAPRPMPEGRGRAVMPAPVPANPAPQAATPPSPPVRTAPAPKPPPPEAKPAPRERERDKDERPRPGESRGGMVR